MPYNKDGSHKKNPTKQEWAAYHLRKGTKKKRVGKSGARGGAAIGTMGGGAGGGGGG